MVLLNVDLPKVNPDLDKLPLHYLNNPAQKRWVDLNDVHSHKTTPTLFCTTPHHYNFSSDHPKRQAVVHFPNPFQFFYCVKLFWQS